MAGARLKAGVYAGHALMSLAAGSGSALGSPARQVVCHRALLVGALGQVAYHVLVAGGIKAAPWWISTVVARVSVAVLGMGAALVHLLWDTEAQS